MIRVIAIASLTTLLVAVLYLPSAYPPERFVAQLREEHGRTVDAWNPVVADRIMERMLCMQAQAAAAPRPFASGTEAVTATGRPVGEEMAQIQRRMFDNAYFRSIDALLALASYRAAAILEWLPAYLVFALVFIADALTVRVVKAKEFRHHSPERFAVLVSLAILTLCAGVLALVWPHSLPPITWAVGPVVAVILAARSIADYHRRP